MKSPRLSISMDLWKQLIKELKVRGKGERETGAFLLGKHGNNIITDFICYNDLDPEAFDSGIIVFNGDGYIPLWNYCSANELKVIADVHTHPGSWTGQSSSDKRNPMIAQKGHIALIVPNYAKRRAQLLKSVGVHEFLGDGQWKAIEAESNILLIK